MFNFDPIWEKIHRETEWETAPNPLLLEFIEEKFNGKKELNFLDIGCAVGASTVALAELGHRVTAVDGSETAIQKLIKRIPKTGWVTPICQDITKLVFERSIFDCVVDMATLGELSFEAACDVVAEARGWLKPGGWFFSSQVAAPTDPSLIRTNIRLADFKGIDKMFQGYKCRCYPTKRITNNHKIVSNWIVEAQVVK